ncbi:MAG: hypothetical protein HYS23_01315 [Geobacter sp.]|nr:hypothetical protein [Geobacter sp.]
MKPVGTIELFPTTVTVDDAERAGFRFGAKGTHTSRTMMFDELSTVLASVGGESRRQDYASAIVDDNCLSKPTSSTRRLTNQRLGELYGLDPSIPLFRVFRRLWDLDDAGRRQLALLCAVARDPLLASTVSPILSLNDGAEFLRDPVKAALRDVVGDRLNDEILDKVVRNIASSWSQAGHLEGRTFKKRRLVNPTPATTAFALYLGYQVGFRSADLFASGWMRLLDCAPPQARDMAVEAKRLGLIDLRMSGDVVEINLSRLNPGQGGI